MEQNFVRFLYAGMLASDTYDEEIEAWDVDKAKEMYQTFEFKPYGFYFYTRSRNDNELDSKITKSSNTYFINGIVKTLQDIEAENDHKNETLLWNMKTNKYNKIVRMGCYYAYEFKDDDINLLI